MIRIDKSWTLFLDRDGVINQRLPDDYVRSIEQFHFIERAPEAISILSAIFKHIIVVTNQQGLGKGLMTESELDKIHQKLKSEVEAAGGRIDFIFYSPDLKNSNSFTRKPAVGMGLKAKKMFPLIQFRKSFMVGDTPSDIKFGHRLGMRTVLLSKNKKEIYECGKMLHYRFDDLISFALEMVQFSDK